MIVEHICECADNHWIVDLKRVNCMLYELSIYLLKYYKKFKKLFIYEQDKDEWWGGHTGGFRVIENVIFPALVVDT